MIFTSGPKNFKFFSKLSLYKEGHHTRPVELIKDSSDRKISLVLNFDSSSIFSKKIL